jgi:hypothetical protein
VAIANAIAIPIQNPIGLGHAVTIFMILVLRDMTDLKFDYNYISRTDLEFT